VLVSWGRGSGVLGILQVIKGLSLKTRRRKKGQGGKDKRTGPLNLNSEEKERDDRSVKVRDSNPAKVTSGKVT
jgi:hypothetical protein